MYTRSFTMASYNFETLESSAKERYLKKLKTIKLDNCPYRIPADSWLDEPTQWPSLEWPEVYDYLVNTPGVFTRESMRNRKSLEAHNQFTSGWVKAVYHFEKPRSNVMILKAEVTPSQRLNEEPHVPWIALCKKSDTVITAHCTCMAGLGESCSHVGALLFKVGAAVRTGYTRTTCTEEACAWNNDFMKNIDTIPLAKVGFYSKKVIDSRKQKESVSLKRVWDAPSSANKEGLLEQLIVLPEKSVALHSFDGYADSFVPTQTPPNRICLPDSLRKLYAPTHASKSSAELSEIVENVLATAQITEETAEYIYTSTKRQSSCIVWHELRVGRITASIAHDVVRTSFLHPSESLILRICKESSMAAPNVPALKWGIDNEDSAMSDLQIYLSDRHSTLNIKKCGLKLCQDFPFIGASPDGIFSCQCHGSKYLIEIKCPFSKRETKSLNEAIIMESKFFIDGKGQLKNNHKYYTQIQLQLHVFECEHCFLVTWTPNWMSVTDIKREDKFVTDMVSTLKAFQKKHVIPELLTRKLEHASSNSLTNFQQPKKFCFCQSEEDTSVDWVGCDDVNCKFEWFHLYCLKLKHPPRKNPWYCPVCRKRKPTLN